MKKQSIIMVLCIGWYLGYDSDVSVPRGFSVEALNIRRILGLTRSRVGVAVEPNETVFIHEFDSKRTDTGTSSGTGTLTGPSSISGSDSRAIQVGIDRDGAAAAAHGYDLPTYYAALARDFYRGEGTGFHLLRPIVFHYKNKIDRSE